MSSANATARVTVSLIDRLSAPARIIQNSMRGIRGDMAALSGARLGISRQLDDAAARASKLRSSLLSIGGVSVVGGLGIAKAIKPAVAFETTLTDIRIKAGLTRVAMNSLGDEIKAMGPKVNRSAQEMAQAVDFLMGMGLDKDRTMGIMPSVGKTATAFGANIEDIAKAGHSSLTNLKVPINEIAKAFDVMAESGNQGGFELKAMARYLPEISAMAQNIGIKGVKGVAELTAALQVVREASGTEEAAANNFINVLQKMESPETRKKFKKVGIDITKEIEAGQNAGISPIETLSIQTKKALAKKGVRIGDLFEDRQAQIGVLALIDKLEKWREIRDKSLATDNVVDDAYKARMETFQAVIDRVSAQFQKLGIALGTALFPNLTMLADKLGPLVEGLTGWVSANSELASAAVLATGALLGLAAFVGVVKLAGAALSILGLKGARGLLNYLAPKAPPAAAGAAVPKGASVPLTPAAGTPKAPASPATPAAALKGGLGTATTPRMLTPAEIARAGQKFNPLARPGLSSLKGGLAGAAVSIVGETLIDKMFDALPKPAYPAGYDPKAQADMSIVERITGMLERSRAPAARPEAHRLDAGDMERSRRVQDENKRDPEGARGRAMQQRDVVSDASVGADSKATGVAAGADVGQGIKDGLASTRAGIMAEVDGILAAARAKLAGAGLTLNITPSLSGGGAALRAIHSDTGIH